MDSEKFKSIIGQLEQIEDESQLIQIHMISGQIIECIIEEKIIKQRFLADSVETVDYPTYLKVSILDQNQDIIANDQIIDVFQIHRIIEK